MAITVEQAIARLLDVVAELQGSFPRKKFTLDGRLLGDLGEVLVAAAYDVTLADGLQKRHDGSSSDGRSVQIKATMKDSLTFPAGHVPDFYLGIKIYPNGTFSEVFNGPGMIAQRAIENRKQPKTNLHSVSVSALRALNDGVEKVNRIGLRPGAEIRPIEWKGR